MLATTLPPVLPVSVAAATPSAPAGNGNGPDSFARMLDAADARRQAQTQAATNKATESRPAERTPADRTAAEKSAAERNAAEKTAADKTAAGQQDAAAPTEAAGSSANRPGDEADPADAAATAVDATAEQPLHIDAAAATDAAALLAGLAALPRSSAADAQAAVASGTLAGQRSVAEATADTGSAASPREAVDSLDTAGAAPRRTGALASSTSDTHAGQARDNFNQLMRQARAEAGAAGAAAEGATQRLQLGTPQAAEAPPAHAEGLAPGAALLATAAAPGVPGGSVPAAVGHARLVASPGSPEFAGQLGAQLTTFVREGVQHARLELHPLELGPVTVQIAIDGSQARVNLAAEHAATRQALEQAMPALAGSLREAGLTLSGGGVFEQPRQPQPDGGTATSEGRGGRDGSRGGSDTGERAGSGPAAQAGVPLRRRGVVDLVA